MLANKIILGTYLALSIFSGVFALVFAKVAGKTSLLYAMLFWIGAAGFVYIGNIWLKRLRQNSSINEKLGISTLVLFLMGGTAAYWFGRSTLSYLGTLSILDPLAVEFKIISYYGFGLSLINSISLFLVFLFKYFQKT